MGRRTAKNRGFTIVELITVIIVISILAILVINTISGAQKKARDAVRSDDIHALVGQLISYNTVNNGLPKPSNYGENNVSGYDLSAAGDWLPFLATSASGKIPKDPINNETGDPFAIGAKLTYFYACFKKTDSGAPSATNDTGRIGYRNEYTNQIKSVDFTVETCKD
jgi:prepilin-type N-terminal cleavage/methylation domain-containing protein